MKRYFRTSSNASCMIPRKTITLLLISLVVITILAFILIEVRRIIAVKDFTERKQSKIFYPSIFNSSLLFTNDHFKPFSSSTEVSKQLLTKPAQNYDEVYSLFDDYPLCFEKPYLLILVASAPENFKRREAIRKSWANKKRWKLQVSKLRSKTVFLVGNSSAFLNILLKNENDISGDILTGEYLDTYRNLTLKVMHGFQWAERYCQPDFLLKTDDDCFVNVPILLQFLLKFNPVPVNLYAGRVRWSAPVVRDPNSRWYVSSLEYPGPRYAPYANGAGYILSKDALEKLVMFSGKVQVFPNEDAYVGAVLHLAGIRPTYSARFVTHPGPWKVCNYLYLFVVHRIKASLQREQQDMANKAIDICSNENIIRDWV